MHAKTMSEAAACYIEVCLWFLNMFSLGWVVLYIVFMVVPSPEPLVKTFQTNNMAFGLTSRSLHVLLSGVCTGPREQYGKEKVKNVYPWVRPGTGPRGQSRKEKRTSRNRESIGTPRHQEDRADGIIFPRLSSCVHRCRGVPMDAWLRLVSLSLLLCPLGPVPGCTYG